MVTPKEVFCAVVYHVMHIRNQYMYKYISTVVIIYHKLIIVYINTVNPPLLT